MVDAGETLTPVIGSPKDTLMRMGQISLDRRTFDSKLTKDYWSYCLEVQKRNGIINACHVVDRSFTSSKKFASYHDPETGPNRDQVWIDNPQEPDSKLLILGNRVAVDPRVLLAGLWSVGINRDTTGSFNARIDEVIVPYLYRATAKKGSEYALDTVLNIVMKAENAKALARILESHIFLSS